MKSIARSITLLSSIFIFHCAGFSTEGPSVFAKADSLRNAGQLRLASIEYERVNFFSNNAEIGAKALLSKAGCLKQLGRFSDAEYTLSRVRYGTINDTLAANCRFQNALCAYLVEDFGLAESHLLQLQAFVKDENLTKPSYLLYSLVLNEQNRWDEARATLVEWSRLELNELEQQQFDSLVSVWYAPKVVPKLKKQKTARWLSMLMPGTGQWYAGYLGHGMVNALLQLAFAAGTVYAVIVGYYVTAFLVGYSSVQRFYVGGLTHTEYLVNKRNHKNTSSFNNNVKGQLLKYYGEYLK